MKTNYFEFKSILFLFIVSLSNVLYGEETVSNDGIREIQGVDVSHFQGQIDWKQLAGEKIHFAIAKATGGETYVDPQFEANWHGMRTAEITRGAYHFFYAADDPIKQADHYLKFVGSLKGSDLPPIVDVEISDNVSPKTLFDRLSIWLQAVEIQTGRIPMIYTNADFGIKFLNHECLKNYPLWLADYSAEIEKIPSSWETEGWSIWQYSSSGSISGIKGDVDLDVFNGDRAKFDRFLRKRRSPEKSCSQTNAISKPGSN